MTAIDATTFWNAPRLDPDAAITGDELHKVFWRAKALEQELDRQRTFWKATNDTLAEAFAEMQRKELELEAQHVLLTESNIRLQMITERLQQELSLARTIQQRLLPPRQPVWPGSDVMCYCQPAREVGGDFYDYHALAEERLGLAVGDVSDKGLPAALLMATSLAHFDSALASADRPDRVLAYLDRVLTRYADATGHNCALCYVEINNRTLLMANAGGISPYIRRADGSVHQTSVGGLPLGVGNDRDYHTETAALEPGDMVVLVSDGMIEAMAAGRQMYGFDRFARALHSGPATTAGAMLEHLIANVAAFVGNAEPHDDVTIVVCQVAES